MAQTLSYSLSLTFTKQVFSQTITNYSEELLMSKRRTEEIYAIRAVVVEFGLLEKTHLRVPRIRIPSSLLSTIR